MTQGKRKIEYNILDTFRLSDLSSNNVDLYELSRNFYSKFFFAEFHGGFDRENGIQNYLLLTEPQPMGRLRIMK